MYVRSEAQLSSHTCTNASGVAPTLFWRFPVKYPLVWGMGGNTFQETNLWSECEAAPPATRWHTTIIFFGRAMASPSRVNSIYLAGEGRRKKKLMTGDARVPHECRVAMPNPLVKRTKPLG